MRRAIRIAISLSLWLSTLDHENSKVLSVSPCSATATAAASFQTCSRFALTKVIDGHYGRIKFGAYEEQR